MQTILPFYPTTHLCAFLLPFLVSFALSLEHWRHFKHALVCQKKRQFLEGSSLFQHFLQAFTAFLFHNYNSTIYVFCIHISAFLQWFYFYVLSSDFCSEAHIMSFRRPTIGEMVDDFWMYLNYIFIFKKIK